MKNLYAVACLALVLAVLGSSRAATSAEKNFPRLALYERFVAIDEACGWPLVTVLPDGALGCLIWPVPLHGFTEGAVEFWKSTDDGRAWRKAGVPVTNSPTQNRMNHAGGVAADGLVIALVGGWDQRLPAGWRPNADDKRAPGTHFTKANTLHPVPAVSRDGGATWRQFSAVTAPAQENDQGFVPYGRIAPLADGTLGVMMYRDELSFFTSADDGGTWKKRGEVSRGRVHNETAWLRLANGDLFAAARAYGPGNTGNHAGGGALNQQLFAFRSKDAGATWAAEGELTLPMQHPADLTRLPDGRVLLSYGVRNDGDWGIAYRIGDPEARGWSAPVRLVDLEGSTNTPDASDALRDGGYPSTVMLADSTLVTAYYSKGVPAHRRYHVGVVRWRLPTAPVKPALP
ncbi:MAG: exo-alpha-sialidase [Opitutaceae bacterium]